MDALYVVIDLTKQRLQLWQVGMVEFRDKIDDDVEAAEHFVTHYKFAYNGIL
ncbi:hypothetical protein KFU94_40045 [Chloroflexi bacterium TSY]|nr:hypothetical protein [Chloroflexi bacterium TSY]